MYSRPSRRREDAGSVPGYLIAVPSSPEVTVRSIALHILILAMLACPSLAGPNAAEPSTGAGVRTLFDGKDLSGWDSLLGPAEKGAPPLGKNHDVKNVFSVVEVDGKPAIRVSGQVWGGLTTREEFENYHLRVEFKWGQKRWPPRERAVRDSGIIYHCVGDPAPQTGWLTGAECQIEEMDCGDFWSVHEVLADAQTRRMDTSDELRRQFDIWCKRNEGRYPPFAFQPGGATITIRPGGGLMKSRDAEKPTGQWNVAEIYCLGTTSVHVINGQSNMVLTNLRRLVDGKEVPLGRGKIQLQSEGAEIFFRELRVEPITKIPDTVLGSGKAQ